MSQTQQEVTMDRVEAVEKTKTKTRRPPNTAFRQQRLKAWQPILTPKTVLPLFFIIGIIFAPIGGLLLYASDLVQDITINYSGCGSLAPTNAFDDMPSGRVISHFKGSSNNSSTPAQWMRTTRDIGYGTGTYVLNTSVCMVQFNIPNDMGAPVYLYYQLTKFYQNHRRYVKSQDQDQLEGNFVSNSTISSSDCDPLRTDPVTGKAYYPCGLIANSIFNDTIGSPVLLNSVGSAATNQTYNMTSQGTAWSTDANLYGKTAYTIYDVVPPPNWRLRYPYGNYSDEFPLFNPGADQAFQVWMRTAGLPTFSKLALRNDNTAMTAGRYQIDIFDYFPVEDYGGTKSILISTRTIIGGKNPFLGIAYVIIGGICIVLGAVFLAIHLIRPRRLGDHTYLSWNSDQPTAATASGRSLRPNDTA